MESSMKTIVKYIVLKSKEYQLGSPLPEVELNESADYFDQIPDIIEHQNHKFKVLSKELSRKKTLDDDIEEVQQIVIKMVAFVA